MKMKANPYIMFGTAFFIAIVAGYAAREGAWSVVIFDSLMWFTWLFYWLTIILEGFLNREMVIKISGAQKEEPDVVTSNPQITML